jgi:hypothetical protein
MHLIDSRTGGEDDFHAPAANVHHGSRAPLEIEMSGGAAKRQLRLFLSGDDVDANLVSSKDFAAEGAAVCSLSNGAGRYRPQLSHFETVGDCLHLAEGRQSPLHRFVRQTACPIQLFAEAHHLSLFVQDSIGAIVLDFGDCQPNGVGPNVDGTQTWLGRRLRYAHMPNFRVKPQKCSPIVTAG